MSVNEGSLVLTFDSGPDVTLTPAVVRPATVRYDRAQHRAPYGTAWFTSGTGEREPEQYEVTFEAYASTLVAAGAVARDAVTALQDAVTMVTPFGEIALGGVLGFSVSPVEFGYRVDARVVVSESGFVGS